MAFDIVNFRSALANRGILKPNKYQVRTYLPRGIGGAHMDTVRDMELFGEMAEIPSMSLMTGEVMRYGYGAVEKRPFAPMYGTCTVSFIADADGDILEFFKAWHNLIVAGDARGGINTPNADSPGAFTYELSYKTDYVTDLELMIYRDVINPGTLVKTVTLRDAYPYGFGQTKLEWADNNTYLRIPVTFTFTDVFMS